ncbi:MAG: prepilin-type N-terminal cleavage/methylation domain-containing protein [Candidatus Saccharimonadales bacterium]
MKVNQSGFTIIELMIATAVFTVILIITTTTLIGISETYIKGSVEGQTQQTARTVLSDISSDIQLNNPNINISDLSTNNKLPDEFYFCIGNDVYAYQLDQVVSSNNWALVRYTAGCPNSPPSNPLNNPEAEELLSANERLGELSIAPVTSAGNAIIGYTIQVEVGYGNNTNGNSLINDKTNPQWNPPPPEPLSPNKGYGYVDYPYQCQGGTDSSFCAVSTLTTTVSSRITNI